MRKIVVKALRPKDAMSVENPERPGTPDVNYIGGWIELKILKTWPVRGGVVAVRCFTPQQRTWIRRRAMKGGNVHFLIRVQDDWLLFGGIFACDHIGSLTKEEMLVSCKYHSAKSLDGKALWEAMSK